MWSKECELLKKLTDAELESLTKLCRCGSCDGIPMEHTAKLHELGLAELTCGGLGPTSAGRHAVQYQASRLAAE